MQLKFLFAPLCLVLIQANLLLDAGAQECAEPGKVSIPTDSLSLHLFVHKHQTRTSSTLAWACVSLCFTLQLVILYKHSFFHCEGTLAHLVRLDEIYEAWSPFVAHFR